MAKVVEILHVHEIAKHIKKTHKQPLSPNLMATKGSITYTQGKCTWTSQPRYFQQESTSPER